MIGKYRYFYAGGNTPEGFISYYSDVMPQEQAFRIFCIKGGPGTGKSTFMKYIGKHYLELGIDVDYLKCSSDPESIDGIVLKNKSIAFLDGTSPHITDPINPGAVDEIIDLAKFIDIGKLENKKADIIKLVNTISAAFQYAYVYLNCAGAEYDHLNKIFNRYVDETSVVKFISYLDLPNEKSINGRKKRYFGSSINSQGMVNELSGLVSGIDNVYLVDMPAGYKNGFLMKNISEEIIRRGYDVEELYCPLLPRALPEHIISTEANIAVLTCNEFHDKNIFDGNNVTDIKSVNIKDIYEIDKTGINEMKKDMKSNIDKAITALKHAKAMHDDLENYYVDAMDFSGVDNCKSEMIEKIDELIG